MSDPLYTKDILRLAADAHGAGHLSHPTASASAHNPTCGDRVAVELAVDDTGRITDFAQDTQACLFAQASASLLGRSLGGADRDDVARLMNAVAGMLVTKSPPPAAPFEGYAAFQGVVDQRARHRCVLLPLEAVIAAFDTLTD